MRLRCRELSEGQWEQAYGEGAGAAVLWQRAVASDEALAQACGEAQRSLDLSQGPLLRAVLLDLWDGTQRLLLVIHHLVVDGVSWRVLLEDLSSAYQSLTAGREVALPAKTTSFQAWASRLESYASSEALQDEVSFWTSQVDEAAASFPCDYEAGSQRVRDQAEQRAILSARETTQLLREAPSAYRTQVNDLLLTALSRALCRWSGSRSVSVELEGHGREDLFDDVDVSRTVGWFTSMYPVLLTPAADVGASIKAVKEQLRAVPQRGIGFGVLSRWGEESVRRALATQARPRVTFNYLGQLDLSAGENGLFALGDESVSSGQDGDVPLLNLLSVNGAVSSGQLSLSFAYSRELFEEDTVA
ncbi:MAG TPA: condensation domain-containing protein, partial [Polyangiales bacterium]|nr:condensation domain-containing protein [Polyangiales bacterium]